VSAILIALRNLVESSDGVMAGTWFHDSLDKAKEALEAIDASPAPTERRIVQIATAAVGNDVSSAQWALALCTDGTVWQLDPMRSYSGWHSLPPIPQDQPNWVQS
jgi:hypothetical protein